MLSRSVSVVALIVAVSLQAPAGQTTAAPDVSRGGRLDISLQRDGFHRLEGQQTRIVQGRERRDCRERPRQSRLLRRCRSSGTRSDNFELKVDVMVKANANGGSNGGVYILTEFEERGGNVRASGDFPSKGFEIQINNAYTRDQVKTGSLYHVADITESPVKDDEWFTFHIVVKDQTITVKVNEHADGVVDTAGRLERRSRGSGTHDHAGRSGRSRFKRTMPTVSSTTRTSASSRWHRTVSCVRARTARHPALHPRARAAGRRAPHRCRRLGRRSCCARSTRRWIARGRTIVGLHRLGKRIVFELEGELFLVFHLMIAGRFRWRGQAGGRSQAQARSACSRSTSSTAR